MPFDKFIRGGVDQVWMGVIDTSGDLIGGSDGATAPAAGDSAGNGMIRVKGVSNADPTVAPPDAINFPGDNGSEGQMPFDSPNSPAFNVDKAMMDLALNAIATRTKTYDEGGIRMGVLKPNKFDPEDICWIIQAPSKKKDMGLGGLRAWSGYFVMITNVTPLGWQAYATRTAGVDRLRVISNPADQLFNGLDIDTANFDTEGGCVLPFDSDYPVYGHRWTGDGTEDTYTLPFAPAAYDSDTIRIRVNGTLAVFGTDYIITSGLDIVFQAGHIPALNSKIVGLIGYKKTN